MLAQLNHPGIARLLEGGERRGTAGTSRWSTWRAAPCSSSAKALDVRGRLQLFRRVCAAVQYAHLNLVVHRDIKPANILVTGDGQPKLLDFGIAKLIEEPEHAAAQRTMTLLLTPDYASPEQVRGDPVTTGRTLLSGLRVYELLSGSGQRIRYPHSGRLERVTREVEPLPPGRFASLDLDLDNVVLKALRKDPAARYATVEQLSDDLASYLEGWPVSARRPTLAYRARKFVARNRLAVTAVTLTTSAVLIGAGVALRQAHEASLQRELAEHRAREGRRLANTVLFSVEEKIRNLSGRWRPGG